MVNTGTTVRRTGRNPCPTRPRPTRPCPTRWRGPEALCFASGREATGPVGPATAACLSGLPQRAFRAAFRAAFQTEAASSAVTNSTRTNPAQVRAE